jgi:hypothetical protein
MPPGTLLSAGMETNRAVAKPAATSASALSNTQALGSRRDPLARCFMT